MISFDYLGDSMKTLVLLNHYSYLYFYNDCKNILMNTSGIELYKGWGYMIFLKKNYIKGLDLSNFFYCWYNFIVKKVKFKHKTSWLYMYSSSMQILKLTLGFSHKIYFFIFFSLKSKKKYLSSHTLTLWGMDSLFLMNWMSSFVSWLLYSKYTSSGFSPARFSFLKSMGKISSYTAFKSKMF